MHIETGDVPIKVNAPGAVARQQTDFGDATEQSIHHRAGCQIIGDIHDGTGHDKKLQVVVHYAFTIFEDPYYRVLAFPYTVA